MKRTLFPLFALFLVCPTVPAQAKREPLADRVRVSIDRAVKYLREKQLRDGSWEVEGLLAGVHPGGTSALTVLALLNAGLPATDPAVKRGLEYLRTREPKSVYTRALQTMVFVEARQKEDLARIAGNIKYLTEVGHGLKTGKLEGWSYHDTDRSIDNSNTQYALLGLWSGSQANVKLNRALWETIREYYLRTQAPAGSWSYSNADRPSLTMTVAGVCGLFISGMELALPCSSTGEGKGRRCGDYPDAAAIDKGIRWVSDRFTLDLPLQTFYHIYGLERLGRLSGERFIGKYDWYREGCTWLVDNQKKEGLFSARGEWDQWPVVSTSFALLFLSKGRTPVLVSKLVHYNRERRDDGDWNNDRNDLRNLVSFSSTHLFKEMPLAWQSFDILAALGGARTEDAIADAASELLQSPILYITGHGSPFSRLTTIEKQVIKRYVESGGFIFAEACCSREEFDTGFKQLVKDDELWPDNDLSELNSKHPVWSSHFLIKPGDPYPLYGISMGCKTVLIYSPRDMSCFWEGNLFQDGQGDRAFKLGTNIIAYATGKVPPKPRLTEMEVVRGKDDGTGVRRGFLQVAQIEHGGDSKPAPQAMRNLMDHVNRLGIHVVRTPVDTRIDEGKVLRHKFLYMHGRGKFAFREAAADEESPLEYLRFNLNNGGLLLADACCGNEEFDKSFRDFARQLFPDRKLERVPEDDILFSKKLTGTELSAANIRIRVKSGEEPRPMAPYLEGIRIDGRWVLLYSKYDIGCALERHTSSDCVGYLPDSAFRIATAAVIYTYWPAYGNSDK